MGWIAAVGERRASPPAPPPECVGIPVAAGANLHTVISTTNPDTYCLAAGTYDLGGTSLEFASGTIINGAQVTVGPNGEIDAPTKIVTTSGGGVIQATGTNMSITLRNLDISGSPKIVGQPTSGRGINGNGQRLVNCLVEYCRIHDNGANGIGAVREGLRVSHCEIDHNGSGSGGTDGGIKTVDYAHVSDSYFHHNSTFGMWWDCDVPGGIIEDCKVTFSELTGIYVEISSGEASSPKLLPGGGATYGFKVRRNSVTSNNTTSTGGHGGIGCNGSMHVLFLDNIVTGNNNQEIMVADGGRAGQGHNGCSSGFCMTDIVVQGNTYGPGPLNVNGNTAVCGSTTGRVTLTGNTQI